MRLSDRYWLLVVLRAVPAAVIALVITFNSDHSATLGFWTLGSFAIVTGALILGGHLRLAQASRARSFFLIDGALWLVGGIVLLALSDGDLGVFLFGASTLLGVTGAIELIIGLLSRRTDASRDWTFVGALTAVLASVLVLIPADFVQVIESTGDIVPPLTASTIAVGALGAWAVVIAVYLAIAGFSLKWSKTPSEMAQE